MKIAQFQLKNDQGRMILFTIFLESHLVNFERVIIVFFLCWHFTQLAYFFLIFTQKEHYIIYWSVLSKCLPTLQSESAVNIIKMKMFNDVMLLLMSRPACSTWRTLLCSNSKYLCIYTSRPDLGKATKLWLMPQSQNCPMESVSRTESISMPGSAWSRHFIPTFVLQASIQDSYTWMTGIWISRTFWSFRVFSKASRPTSWRCEIAL